MKLMKNIPLLIFVVAITAFLSGLFLLKNISDIQNYIVEKEEYYKWSPKFINLLLSVIAYGWILFGVLLLLLAVVEIYVS